MDLRSHYPYSLLWKGIIKSYPSLKSDIKTEVAVIGAGITGTLVAWHLCKAGVKVVLVDRRHVGMGSTAASTGLLQYEIDTPLYKLIEKVGEKNAVKSYLLTRKAIYDLTEIVAIHKRKRSVELVTSERKKIRANKIVIACGYESQKYLPRKLEKMHVTYSIASEPLPFKNPWYKKCLIWETAFPYIYLRTTSDNRVLIGGKDSRSSHPGKRDIALNRKSTELENAFRELFPDIPFKTDFKWSGTFADTKDGLPYIGSFPGNTQVLFALGYGGNGITFGELAAQIITDIITGKPDSNIDLFEFNR